MFLVRLLDDMQPAKHEIARTPPFLHDEASRWLLMAWKRKCALAALACIPLVLSFLGIETLAVDGPLPSLSDKEMIDKEVRLLFLIEDYPRLEQHVKKWPKLDPAIQERILLCLADKLDSPRPLRLVNYAGLHVESRVINGKMPFFGCGSMILQDIFIERGRSAWAIEALLRIKRHDVLPAFTEDMPAEELAKAIRATRAIVADAVNR